MSFIRQHIYLFLLLLTIAEGPIISFVSAGFAAWGILRIEYVIVLVILGDLISDVIFYFIGRCFHRIPWMKRFHTFVTQRNILKKLWERSKFLYFLLVKITPYLAIPSLISLGIKRMNFRSYMRYSFITTVVVKTVYLSFGYLGSFTIAQTTRFLDGRKIIVLYGLVAIVLFLGIKKGYSLLSETIRNRLKKAK